jgi:AraC-like DNA-binding protein
MAMEELRQRLAKAIRTATPSEGYHPSPVSGVACLKIYKSDLRTKRRWRACLAIVAQGEKEIILGRGVYRIGAGDYSAAPLELPVVSRFAAASPEKPFLGLLVDLDPRVLGEVAAALEEELLGRPVKRQRALFIGAASERMLEVAVRIMELTRTPEDAGVLGPLAIRELIYHLLRGPNGPGVYQFVRSGSKTHRVHQAIYALRAELCGEVDVDALARGASMSRSAFFKHFKEVTAISPIQYRKRLRLLEARRLMADERETAEGAAFRVGYKSASQFSREYSRMFGNAPRRDIESLKQLTVVIES